MMSNSPLFLCYQRPLTAVTAKRSTAEVSRNEISARLVFASTCLIETHLALPTPHHRSILILTLFIHLLIRSISTVPHLFQHASDHDEDLHHNHGHRLVSRSRMGD
jgi:hypothetical protein